MMTITEAFDHAPLGGDRKQMNQTHFADCSSALSQHIDQSKDMALIATGERCDDFTTQFLLNQAARSRRA